MIETPLLLYVVGMLTPLLMTGGLTESVAQQAAREAIALYPGGPLTAARAAALVMAVLDNLRLSADAELSVSLKLKLRGNAAALTRAERATAPGAPGTGPAPETTPPPPDDAVLLDAARDLVAELDGADRREAWPDARGLIKLAAETPPGPPVSPTPTAKPLKSCDRGAPAKLATSTARPPALEPSMWADAMTEVAAELSQGLSRLNPADRAADVMRIGLLTEAADRIRRKDARGKAARGKAALFTGSTLATGLSDPNLSDNKP